MGTPVSNVIKQPPSFFDKVKKGFGDCIKNEIVKQIAMTALCLMIGAGVGALIGSAIGATPIILGAIIGGVVGGFVYAAVVGVLHVIKIKGYPAHAHTKSTDNDDRNYLSKFKDWGSDENLQVCKDVVKEQYSQKPWYKEWKAHKKFQEDYQAAEYLFGKWIQKGASVGEAQVLLITSKSHPDLKGEDLLRKVRAEYLFIRQVPEFIRKDLIKEGERGELLKAVTKQVEEIPDLEVAKTIRYDLKNFASFKTDLKQYLGSGYTAATFQLNGGDKQMIYISLKRPYRFYDSFSKKFGGLHEDFKSEDDFIEKLSKHLECYRSLWRLSRPQVSGTIKFYR